MTNEKRLIDANALLEKLKKTSRYFTVKFDIEEALTVDAVEVVRCKDCKHKGWIQEPFHGRSVDFCHVWDSCINSPEKCFCFYGKRKDDD